MEHPEVFVDRHNIWGLMKIFKKEFLGVRDPKMCETPRNQIKICDPPTIPLTLRIISVLRFYGGKTP